MIIKKFFSFLNLLIVGTLILIFEHIEKYSYFGFLNPWIAHILIFFLMYFALFMFNFKTKPKGALLFLTLALFILVQFLISSGENFRTSFILLLFILIASLIIKNSERNKQILLLNIIKYCCLINCIYGIFFNEVFMGSRVGGLDQAPVLFGYNMLLGFWLSIINLKKNPDSKKNEIILNLFFALAFIIGIFLSQSRGAIFGLVAGLLFVFFYSKKINIKISIYLVTALLILSVSFIYNPAFYYETFGLQRIIDIFTGDKEEERFIIWTGMLKVYYEEFHLLKFLFGGGQGSATDLIGRGVHSDHFKLIFDYGVIGYSIYLIKIFNCFNLIRNFNNYLSGFLVSTLASGLFYTNVGSITNSFSYYLVLFVLFNFIRPSIKK